MPKLKPFLIGDLIEIRHQGGSTSEVELLDVPRTSAMPKQVDVRWKGVISGGTYAIKLETGELIYKRKPLLWKINQKDLNRLIFTVTGVNQAYVASKKPKSTGKKYW